MIWGVFSVAMAAAEQLRELNMTADEVDRLRHAFRDENFRKMLHEYAQEISDPENKRRYEEDIRRLEMERGNTVEFIHPGAFRAIKTSVNGEQKCFVNICSSDKVGKPKCESVVSEDGRKGARWSLPHSLHPGRQDFDGKRNKIMIYDVVFHPDTLHLAGKSQRFMNIVENTAMQGIQEAFKVTLDQKNVKRMKTKYKGAPQACVVRRPIPGYKASEPLEHPDPLSFPYPPQTTPASMQPASAQNGLTETQRVTDAKPPNLGSCGVKEPTKPKYSVKYRSFIDLQDFTCSRDQAQSHRPKEIVVSVDLPLLKSAKDISLEVKDGLLLLESQRPTYRLELPLAYPVDEDKGAATFDKQRRQLVVTLPIHSLNAALDVSTQVGDGESEAESHSMEDKDHREKEKEKERTLMEGKIVEETQTNEKDVKEERKVKKERSREESEELMRKGGKSEEDGGGPEEGDGGQVQERGVGDGVEKANEQVEGGRVEWQNVKSRKDVCDGGAQEKGHILSGLQCEASVHLHDRPEASPETEKQLTLTSEEETRSTKEVRAELAGSWEPTPKLKAINVPMELEMTGEAGGETLQVIYAAASLDCEESLDIATESSTLPAPTAGNPYTGKDDCVPKPGGMSSQIPAGDEGSTPGVREAGDDSAQPRDTEGGGEDGLPAEQSIRTSPPSNRPPAVLLREVDKDGNETVISDHSTSAGFTFQNTLMFELD